MIKHVTEFLSQALDGNDALHACCMLLTWKVFGIFSLEPGIFPSLTLFPDREMPQNVLKRTQRDLVGSDGGV